VSSWGVLSLALSCVTFSLSSAIIGTAASSTCCCYHYVLPHKCLF
jgi:hypothetical protein